MTRAGAAAVRPGRRSAAAAARTTTLVHPIRQGKARQPNTFPRGVHARCFNFPLSPTRHSDYTLVFRPAAPGRSVLSNGWIDRSHGQQPSRLVSSRSIRLPIRSNVKQQTQTSAPQRTPLQSIYDHHHKKGRKISPATNDPIRPRCSQHSAAQPIRNLGGPLVPLALLLQYRLQPRTTREIGGGRPEYQTHMTAVAKNITDPESINPHTRKFTTTLSSKPST